MTDADRKTRGGGGGDDSTSKLEGIEHGTLGQARESAHPRIVFLDRDPSPFLHCFAPQANPEMPKANDSDRDALRVFTIHSHQAPRCCLAAIIFFAVRSRRENKADQGIARAFACQERKEEPVCCHRPIIQSQENGKKKERRTSLLSSINHPVTRTRQERPQRYYSS